MLRKQIRGTRSVGHRRELEHVVIIECEKYLTDEQKKELEDGLLTACARNDNDYYEYWKTLFGNQKTESLEENAGVSEISLFEKLTTSESEPVIKTEKLSRFVKD